MSELCQGVEKSPSPPYQHKCEQGAKWLIVLENEDLALACDLHVPLAKQHPQLRIFALGDA